MNSIYDEYGYYINKTESYEFEGSVGMKKMSDIMSSLRSLHPVEIAGSKITDVADYLNSSAKSLLTGKEEKINLPKSNVLSYSLDNGGAVIVRPSGTEPKIKLYITAVGKTKEESAASADEMLNAMKAEMGI